MSWETLEFLITGTVPILFHNGALADPMCPWTKEMKKLTGKRPKTDADYEELARLEWYGSLYLKDDAPCVPGYVLEAAMVSGAKKTRRGKLATAGIVCPDNYLLIYDGPNDLAALWKSGDYRLTVGVRIQRNRIMRTRPIFKEWAVEFDLQYHPEVLNAAEVEEILIEAGNVGLCDWRPRYGRFSVNSN